MRRCFHNPVAFSLGLVSILMLAGTAARGATEPSAELLDLAGRIEYGFYTQEIRAIDTARSGLARLPGRDALRDYYAGLAAYRAALLGAADDGRGLGPVLAECMESGEGAADDEELASEAWVLVAACAVLGARHEPSRSRMYQNRFQRALRQAVAADADNPRITVVRAWAISHRPAHEEAALRDQARQRLEQSLEQFALWSAPFGFPDWGEAEALAHLGEIYLELGDSRGARDFIEQALLSAPDYRFALALQKRVLSNR